MNRDKALAAIRKRRKRGRVRYPPPDLPVPANDGTDKTFTPQEVQKDFAYRMHDFDRLPVMERERWRGDPFPGKHGKRK